MKLTRLLKGVTYELLDGDLSIEVKNITDNSKDVKDGYVFFALSGTKNDGNMYIEEAVSFGAKVVVTEKDYYFNGVTVIKVDNVRKALSIMAFNFYVPDGYNFKTIALTGTNGKTTTSFMIGETLQNAGYSVCIVGTSGVFVNGKQLRGEELTTPDPIDLAILFRFLKEIMVDYVVMEVSAHALYYYKTDAIKFDYAVFSNLTEDHLDFFKTMEAYGKAKERLFKNSKCNIINIDDEYGAIFAKKYTGAITYGKSSNALVKLITVKNNSFMVEYNKNKTKYVLNMPGEYNQYNAISSIAVLAKENIKQNTIKYSLKNLKSISGRCNVFKSASHGDVVLDFAHTPDGLEKILTETKKTLKKGKKLISVFGCGGNRDKAKRSIMGMISGKVADYTIISIDNPRYEDENIVMKDIEEGIKKVTSNYDIVMPRSLAIKRALEMAESGDKIVVSGKGTEPYYEVMGKKHYYREDIVIESLIKELEKK